MPRVRASTMLIALAMLAAASPGRAQGQPPHARHHRLHHHGIHRQASAPHATASEAASTPASTPAPVPNESVSAPITDAAPETKVAPSVFQLHYPPQGEGYVDGSSPQAMDDHNAAKATGVEMKVPLPQ